MDGSAEVYAAALLRTERRRRLLEENRCLESMRKILERMESYLKNNKVNIRRSKHDKTTK